MSMTITQPDMTKIRISKESAPISLSFFEIEVLMKHHSHLGSFYGEQSDAAVKRMVELDALRKAMILETY